MFELTETKIKKWSAEIGIADLGLSELDMRLTNALNVIYSDKFLSSRLYLKGGTAINKLFLQKTARLSDLGMHVPHEYIYFLFPLNKLKV